MRLWFLLVLLSSAPGAAVEQPASAAVCTAAEQCRTMTLDAIARQEYERAHDLAWRVVQTSPRRDRDPAAMALLARAQSLSGRGYDALIMLQRLADLGLIVEDADSSEDFRRVRDYPEWPTLLDRIAAIRNAKTGATGVTGATGASGASGASEAAIAAPTASVPAVPLITRKGSRPPLVALARPSSSRPPSYVSTEVAPVAPPAPLAPVLMLPRSLPPPAALAYDAVSARFVLADANSDLLRVVSETSGNATNLVARGWSGGLLVTAVAIDRRTGNLWVAGSAASGAAVHRLQLISGRLLETIPVSSEAGEAELSALVISGNGVLALDAAGRRIFTIASDRKSLHLFKTLPQDVVPTGMTSSGPSLFVAHTAGILRIDPSTKAHRPVSAPDAIDLAQLYSLAWQKGALLAIQRSSTAAVVRIAFNAPGTRATALEVLGQAAGNAAAASGDSYYYLTRTSESGLAFSSVPSGK